MIRRIVGPLVALGGIVLFGYGLFEYFFDAASKDTFVDLVRGAGIAAMMIGVGVSWAKGKVYGRSTANELARRDAGANGDQST